MNILQQARIVKKARRVAEQIAKAEAEREVRYTRVRAFALNVVTDGSDYGWAMPMTRAEADAEFDRAIWSAVISATLRCDGRVVRRYDRATGVAP